MQPQATPQPTVSFHNLSIEEANTIFASLEELPHKRVSGLIGKLVSQVNQQLNPPAPSLDGGKAAQPQYDASMAPGLSDDE